MMPVETYTGKDGTLLIYVNDAEFNDLVLEYLRTVPKDQWPSYLQDSAQNMFRLTGIGYYPNGMATDGKIYIRWKCRGDAELLAHEYGHILGHDHTDSLSIMNAVTQLRFSDPHDLEQKAKDNFPEPWRKHIQPHEAYRRMVIGGLTLSAVWAWMI